MDKFSRPNIFVSACIEFDHCRFDATMISDDFVKRLKEVSNIIRVCPELSIGLGAPRDAIRLIERKNESLKFVSSKDGIDYTEKMESFSTKYVENLKKKDIDGFLLKAKSPSCGIKNVKIYYDTGKSHVKSSKNAGLFGKHILDAYPNHPVETERRISNYSIREQFFISIFTLASFRELKEDFSYKNLVKFHTENKYLFMTYSQVLLKKLGRIIANKEHLDNDAVLSLYEESLRLILSKTSTKKKRVNVLEHIYGYFKKDVTKLEKDYYFEALDDYLNNKNTYLNVLTILKGWSIRFNQEYLIKQRIFQPFPKQLITLNDSGKNL